MRRLSISVTEAARNFADCVDRAHYQNVTFILLKRGVPFARLVPAKERVCTGRDLAKALKSVDLTVDEASAWARDLRKARKAVRTNSQRSQ